MVGVSEAASDEKGGGNGVEGTFSKDMTNDQMTFEAHSQIVKPLSQTCTHIWRAQAVAQRVKVRVCAYGEVLVCTLAVAFMAVATVWTRNCQKEEKF